MSGQGGGQKDELFQHCKLLCCSWVRGDSRACPSAGCISALLQEEDFVLQGRLKSCAVWSGVTYLGRLIYFSVAP